MSIEQNLCKVKIFQLQSMLNWIRCIDQRFAFKNSRISCLALIFNLNNTRTTVLYSKKTDCRWRNTTSHMPFFSCHWYEPMALWVRVVAESRVTQVWFLMSAETAAPWPFCMALSLSQHWHSSISIQLLCSLYFFFLGFRQWKSRADRVVNLNTTIQLPLFWRTWTRALTSTRPHELAWHAEIIAIV